MDAAVLAGAVLMVAAGAIKLRSPRAGADALRSARLPLPPGLRSAAVRAAGAVEVAVGAAVLLVGGPVPAGALALLYLAAAALVVRLRAVAPRAGCGCFGAASEPVGRTHVVVDLGLACAALWGAWAGVAPAWSHVGSGPAGGLPMLLLTACLAWCCYLLLVHVPALLDAGRKELVA